MISSKVTSKGYKLILITIFTLLISGCGEKKQIKGKNFVPRELMVDMMIDIHLLDGITNDVKYYRKYNPQDSIDLYGSVFEKYEIDRATFDLTLLEYSKFPSLMDEIYDEILMELNIMQDFLDKTIEEERKNKNKLKKEALQKEKKTKAIVKPKLERIP